MKLSTDSDTLYVIYVIGVYFLVPTQK